MSIKVACACGKKLAVKDELAGKKVKCPACQKLLSIPKPKVADDEWDLGDSAEEDFEDEPSDAPVKSRGGKSSPSRGAVSRKSSGKGKGKKSKSSNRGLLIGLSAGGGVLVVALLAWLLWPAEPVAEVAGKPNESSTEAPSTGGTQPAAATSEPRYASFSEFTDGMNETLMAGMVSEGHSVPWTMPGDVSFDEGFPSKENTFVDGATMFADGSIRHQRFRDSIHRPSCRALFTIAGKESSPMSSLYPPGTNLPDPTYPSPQEHVRHSEARTQNKNSLKAIAVAFHNYHETFKHLPPATVFATDGKPLVSWRVLILPFLGEKALFDQYDQSVPWNDPKNAAVLAKMPKVYRDPLSNDPQSTLTTYLVITGPGTAFPTGNAARDMPRPATSAGNPAALAGNNPATTSGTANTPATSPAPTTAKFDRSKILNGAPEAAKGGTLGREVIGTAPLGTNFAVMLDADGQLPPALTQLPDWLAQDAPFDVQQYWVVLPPEQNAAPLYLDALYEFVPHMAVFFPTEVQAKRTMAALVRATRSRSLQLEWDNPNAKRNVAERDAFLQDVAIGFQKLSEAQKRPDCVFDVNWNAPYHVFIPLAAREVLRVGKLQVGRDIERGEFDAAIRMIGSMLRFSRDLRRRTPLAFQYLAEAMTTMPIQDMVIPVLKSPNLKASQCDDLLRLLVQHETSLRAADPFLAKLRGDYVLKRLLLHDLQYQSGEFAESRFQYAFGNTNATRGEALLSAVGFNRVTAAAFGTQLAPPTFAKMFDLQLRGMKPADYEAGAAYLKEKYQVQVNEVGKPIRTQIEALETWNQKLRDAMKSMQAEAAAKIPKDTPREKMESLAMDLFDKHLSEGTLRGSLLASLLTNTFENNIGGRTFSQDDVVMRTRLVGAQALVALRRWYGTHAEPPTDLASVCREAGLSNIPRDPYGDSPLRMTTFASDTPITNPFRKDLKVLAGETVIYSVGHDGVDDQARKGNDFPDFEPGDWLFRLEIPPKSIPVTPAPAAPIQ